MAVIALLECGHYVRVNSVGSPKFGRPDEICPECGGSKYVDNEWKEQWHTDCKDCDFHRSHGFVKAYGETCGMRHRGFYPGHRTMLRWYSLAPLEARREIRDRDRKNRSESSAENDVPPF
jgi:hypothetical protein